MDLEKIIPLIQQAFQNALSQRRYLFGFDRYRGVSNKVASGTLARSVEVKFEKGGVQQNKITRRQFLKGETGINNIPDKIVVLMAEYGQFVQSGRPPGKGKVPISAILTWIKARKLKGRDKKGRYITDRSFAFGIQTNIKKYGIRASNWYDVAIDEIFANKQIEELLGEASVEDLINALEGI